MKNVTRIVATNVLTTGTAFAVTQGDTPQNVFIPGILARKHGVRPGEEFDAVLVPNLAAAERTPWMAVTLARASDEPPVQIDLPLPEPEPEDFDGAPGSHMFRVPNPVRDRVLEVLRSGGVWSVKSMYEHLRGETPAAEGMKLYSACNNAMRSLYNAGLCYMVEVRRAESSRATHLWFTCDLRKVAAAMAGGNDPAA